MMQDKPMMPPKLIDEHVVAQNARRAERIGTQGADFLMQHAVDDIGLRLSTVSRHFDIACDIGSPTKAVLNLLRASSLTQDVFRFAGSTDQAPHCASSIEAVPLKTESVDVITSVLALQFANDLPGTLIQIKRALKPDGLFLGSLLGGQTLHELRTSFLAAEAELTGGASARILPFIDVRDAGGLLQRAGFALPVTDVDTLTVRYDDTYALMRDLRAMGASNPLNARSKAFARPALFQRMNEIYKDRFSDPDGRIRATFDIVSLSGWHPHETQQKPLKPGSADVSLKDVL